MTHAKHTPLRTGNGGNMILSKEGEVLFFIKYYDLAAYIVKAVNCHADLLAALEGLYSRTENNVSKITGINLNPEMQKARAAIAKAKVKGE